jgi:hypothetical protein
MATVFWDMKGVLMEEFMQQGNTINIRSALQNSKKLPRAIQNERCGMPTSSVLLIHDNAHPHRAACTLALLES